jgi:hypothetical protein
VPALTAFLIEQLQASKAWWMPDISGTPDILTITIIIHYNFENKGRYVLD